MKRGVPRPVYDRLMELRRQARRAVASVPTNFSMSAPNARALAAELGYPEDTACIFKGLPIVCDKADDDNVITIKMAPRTAHMPDWA